MKKEGVIPAWHTGFPHFLDQLLKNWSVFKNYSSLALPLFHMTPNRISGLQTNPSFLASFYYSQAKSCYLEHMSMSEWRFQLIREKRNSWSYRQILSLWESNNKDFGTECNSVSCFRNKQPNKVVNQRPSALGLRYNEKQHSKREKLLTRLQRGESVDTGLDLVKAYGQSFTLWTCTCTELLQ